MPDKRIRIIKFVVLPLLIYILVSQAVVLGGKQAAIYFTQKEFARDNHEIEQEAFLEKANSWLLEKSSTINLVNGVCNLLILYFFFYQKYNQEIKEKRMQAGIRRPKRRWYLFCILAGAACSLALNNWIAISGITRVITTYEKVSEHIYSGNILIMSIHIIIVAACMEEILFRGLVYRQLKEQIGTAAGGVLSALLFGILHGNFVQGLYAFLIGLLLVFVYEKYQSMAAPLLVHMAANTVSVLASETAVISAWYRTIAGFLVYTATATILTALCIIQMEVRVKPAVLPENRG